MERSARHFPKAATAVVVRAALVSEETGSAFHPRGGVTNYFVGAIPGGVIHSHLRCKGVLHGPIPGGVLYTVIYGT